MGRPRKNPDDPKWNAQNIENNVHIEPSNAQKFKHLDEWNLYFAAALTGLIARGGLSSEQLIKTASQYADEAKKFTEQ